MSDRLPIFDDEQQEENQSLDSVKTTQPQKDEEEEPELPIPRRKPQRKESSKNDPKIKRKGSGGMFRCSSRSRSPSGSRTNETSPSSSDPWHTNIHPQYEELMGGSVPCPSCYGSGRIPKEREGELVALIPVSDKRLKPRRTWAYVLLGVLICILVSSLLLFFLIPRSIDISSTGYPIEEVSIMEYREHTRLRLNFMNRVNISNGNYYSVNVANASANVINRFNPWVHDIIGSGFNKTGMQVELQTDNVGLALNCTVTLSEGTLAYCESPISKYIALYVLLEFDITVTFEYLNHKEQDTLTTVQQVCCVPSGNCTSSID